MTKYFQNHHIIGIVLFVLAVLYLWLHKFAPSNISKGKLAGSTEYPSAPATSEPEPETPDYMLYNQPTKVPAQQIDLTGHPLAENFSVDNLESAVITEFRGV